MDNVRRGALFGGLAFGAALAVGVIAFGGRSCRGAGEPATPVPKTEPRAEPRAEPPTTAETIPEGHAEAVESARAARQREADLWRELRMIRTCLSGADIELREFRANYRASLIDGAPARRIDEIYRISRDNLQSCDSSLETIEGDGVIAASRYREVIRALLPPLLVLRDYHNERDFLEDGFAVARREHPAVTSGFERFDEATRSLRARATSIRQTLASMLPATPRDLAAEIYFALLALDDLMTANAADAELDAALAAIDAARVEARRVVAELAGSKRADKLDDVLSGSSGALRGIKQRIRARRKDSTVVLGPMSLSQVEYDVMRGR